MNHSPGPAIMTCLKQNEKFGFTDLKEKIRGSYDSEFQNLARSLSIPWHHIYYAERLAGKESKGDRDLLRWFVVHLLFQSGSGHLRTDLNSISNDLNKWCLPDRDTFSGSESEYAKLENRLKEIREDLIGTWTEIPGSYPSCFGPLAGTTPFIYFPERGIVYIRNYYKMEQTLLNHLERLSSEEKILPPAVAPEQELLKKVLRHRLVLLSGGPGTGKTTAVTTLLRSLFQLARDKGEFTPGRILLAAPTGRAANRMIESMRGQLLADPRGEIDEMLPGKAFTLHKMLQVNRESRKALYNRERPLPAELIIVDEASMVDARMMSLLFDALGPDTTLLLAGDRDQLPSVDAGAVFGDFIFGSEKPQHRLHENVLLLTKSWRSGSGILQAADAVLKGDAAGVYEAFDKHSEELAVGELPPKNDMINRILKAYGIPENGFSTGAKEEDLIGIFEKTAVLIPARKGMFGVESLNRAITGRLKGKQTNLYHGQPIMITSNDYSQNLFNGDRGVIVKEGLEYFAVFRDGPDSFRRIPAGKLGSRETAYCQTVHKSQGSEFDTVLLLLPEGSDRLLTREIVYTGITRARSRLSLFCTRPILEKALSRRVVRQSGIREYLGGAYE
ncbi:MAG: exodeoxyribonuclease V subunit alpha [Spirochaetales bacterium]|nr:exodeoxyribonuclease V subunit alpha [Spirochaetales bacterium]